MLFKKSVMYFLLFLIFVLLFSSPVLSSEKVSLFDWFFGKILQNANIDPDSPEAVIAKKIALSYFNPFATEEQLEEDINDLVQLVL